MRRVVVTGMGAITPLGNNVEDFWKAIKKNKCGIGPITKFDTEDFPAKIAGEVKNFKASEFMDKRDARKMATFTQYAVAAAHEAVKQSGIVSGENVDPERFGVILGNGIGGLDFLEDQFEVLFKKNPMRINPMMIPKIIANEAAANVSITFQAKGPSLTIVTACASATDAIGNALNAIRYGQSDVMISGGTEASICKMGIAGFATLHTLSTRCNDEPEKASCPFDKDRDGFIMSEGSGVLVLEELEHAKERGATIYAELAGYGLTCDAGHITSPAPGGAGGARSMELAVQDAGLKMKDVDYINAHGTSTPTNDPIETEAIKSAFGDHAYKLKVSSTKSMTGHLVGAAGGVEAVISVKAILDNFFPATINLNNPEEGCDLDYVANKGVEGKIDVVLSDSLGFGGHNSSIILKRYEG